MRARDHTHRMLQWWTLVGIDRVDLALRRADGSMIWHEDHPIGDLPLAWARAENVRNTDVYIRPARHHLWPLVFLDDVAIDRATAIAAKYAALLVQTSVAGGCHVWLACSSPIGESARAQAQRWLSQRTGADPASVSGEHLGRLAGFKNWKRAGTWVNVLTESSTTTRRWDPSDALAQAPQATRQRGAVSRLVSRPLASGPDTSESAREWGLVCGALEDGYAPDLVYRRLVLRARPRRGRDAERYARRTVERALGRMAARTGRA